MDWLTVGCKEAAARIKKRVDIQVGVMLEDQFGFTGGLKASWKGVEELIAVCMRNAIGIDNVPKDCDVLKRAQEIVNTSTVKSDIKITK